MGRHGCDWWMNWVLLACLMSCALGVAAATGTISFLVFLPFAAFIVRLALTEARRLVDEDQQTAVTIALRRFVSTQHRRQIIGQRARRKPSRQESASRRLPGEGEPADARRHASEGAPSTPDKNDDVTRAGAITNREDHG